jgi:hypothetical protein
LTKDSRGERDGLFSLPCLWARFVLRLTNFINAFLYWVDWSRLAQNEEPSSMSCWETAASLQMPSGLQVNLEIALSGVSAKVKRFDRFQAARNALRRRMT